VVLECGVDIASAVALHVDSRCNQAKSDLRRIEVRGKAYITRMI